MSYYSVFFHDEMAISKKMRSLLTGDYCGVQKF